MRLLTFTIAQDELDRKSDGIHNLQSMLYGFVSSFSITIVSGFWYSFVPRDLNWNASQLVLVIHLVAGMMSLVFFVAFFFLHQKFKEQKWWWLLAPWKVRPKADETSHRFHQRQLGHVTSWILLTTFLTGVLIALPGLLFLFDTVWMQGYYVTQVLRNLHFWVSLLVCPVLFTHMLWVARKQG